MLDCRKAVVTGAFSYSGYEISKLLVANGVNVVTLTNSSPESEQEKSLSKEIIVKPLDFKKYSLIVDAMQGAEVFFNTFWIRHQKEDEAVEYSKILFKAAKEAGVKKIVHISIINPDINSKISYFASKAQVEQALKETGISFSVLRPSFIFGGQKDILISNLAWNIRKFFIFGYIGSGEYELQPIHVKDLAKIAVDQSSKLTSGVFDALGPKKYKYLDFLKLIANKLGLKRFFVPVPFFVAYYMTQVIGFLVKDTIASKEELIALTSNMLAPGGGVKKIEGEISVDSWLEEHSNSLGLKYSK